MTQFAVVRNVERNGKALVEVLRGTACGDGCSACNACNKTPISVKAENEVGAITGDRVQIETQTSMIMSAAFVVYVVPMIMLFLGYWVGDMLGFSEGMSILTGFCGFGVALIVAVVFGRYRTKNPIRYTITRVVEQGVEVE